MKKLITLTKTLLIVAGLLVGGNAWADTETLTLYSQDYEHESDASSWKISQDVTLSLATDNTKYISVVSAGSSRYFYSDFYDTEDFYGDYTAYTLSFDAAITKPSNQSSQIVVMADGHYWPNAAGKNYFQRNSKNYDESENPHLLRIDIAPGGTATIETDGDDNTFTVSNGTWLTFTLDVTTTTVNYSIVNRETKAAVASGTYTLAEGQSYKTKGLFGVLGRYANVGKLFVDNIKVTTEVEAGFVAAPTKIITGAVGTSRKFTLNCITENTTIYWATSDLTIGADGWTEYTGETTTDAATIYAYAEDNASHTSEKMNFATGSGTSVKLNAPVITRSEEGTVTLSSNQSGLDNLEVAPTVDLYYTYGGSEIKYTEAITVSAEDIINAYAKADGYTTSDEVERAVAIRPVSMIQTENASATKDFTSKAFAEESITGEDERTYSPVKLTKDENTWQWGSKVYFNYYTENDVKKSAWDNGIRNGGNWYINGNGIWLLVADVKKDDIIYARSDAKAESAVNATYSEKYSYGNYHAYIVSKDGNVELSFNRISSSVNNYFYGILVYHEPTAIEIAIADCKAYETSAAFATAVADETFSTPADVYAFHTQWQIEQAVAASSDDYTKVIRNAAVADATDWNGAVILNGQQYTDAPDAYYIDRNGATINTNQTIYGLPAGKYQVKVATRANANTYSHIYVSNGSSDICTARGIHAGNTGNDLGNGWAWTYVPFEITETTNILLGFYATTAGGWASCDDWHLYKVTEDYPVTVSATGWATLYTPYALNFEGTGLTAYTATLDEENRTVTLNEVTTVQERTGVVLKGDAGNYKIPLATSSTTERGSLKGSVTWATNYDANYNFYYLAMNNENKAQFTLLADGGSIAAGKAYLQTSVSAARSLRVVFADEATGIKTVDVAKAGNDKIYNVAGQRVATPQKGLFIKNGKKVIIK